MDSLGLYLVDMILDRQDNLVYAHSFCSFTLSVDNMILLSHI